MNNSEFKLELFSRNKSMTTPLSRRVERPAWNIIDESINDAFHFGGNVRLDVLMPEDSYIKSINMISLPSTYRLMLLTRDSDIKREILEWWEPTDSGRTGLVRFGDDDWDIRTTCADIIVAKEIFYDFYETGEVNSMYMENFRSQWNPKP
ncbi:hypothetical protein ABE501_20225 [Comamonas testosteroni]